MRVVLLGSTGLIGSLFLNLALEDSSIESVRALVRRPLARRHARLDQRVVDFERLESGPEGAQLFQGQDALICCLGTTIKKAGSREAFEQVDYHYPMAAARLARTAGVARMLLISSVGASARGGSFYLRVKGRLEESLKELGFARLDILRPSMLTGPRQERRTGEELAIPLFRLAGPLLQGPLAKYRLTRAEDVARLLQKSLHEPATGLHIHQAIS